MIEATKKASLELIRKPLAIAPALALALAMAFAFSSIFMAAFDTLIEFTLENRALNLGLFKMSTVFFHNYATGLLFFSGAIIVLIWLNVILLFFYSKAAMHYEEKDSLSTALSYMLKSSVKAFWLVVFLLVFAFLFGVLFFALAIFLPIGFEAMVFLLLALIIFLGLVFLRLFAFAVPAMVLEGLNVRDSISASWQFSGKKFPETIILSLVAFFGAMVLTGLDMMVLNFTSNDTFSLLITALFDSIIFAFASMLFAFYYFDNPGIVKIKPRPHRRKRK